MNAAKSFEGFDDLGSDFNIDTDITSGAPATIEDASKNKSDSDKGWVIEKCSKCYGTGRWNAPSSLGHSLCTSCSGTGTKKYRHDKATRLANSAKARARKLNKLEAAFIAFEEANPTIAAWWAESNGDNSFAQSLRTAVKKYGDLTERQKTAALNCIEKLAELRRASEIRKAEAKENCKVDVRAVEAAIERAKSKNIKVPKVRMAYGSEEENGLMVVYPASEHSANRGSLYVKGTSGVYLGKVSDGVYYRSREVTSDIEQLIFGGLAHASGIRCSLWSRHRDLFLLRSSAG